MAPSKRSSVPSLVNSQSVAFVEELYERFLSDPLSVSDEWRATFESWPQNGHSTQAPAPRPFRRRSIFNPPGADSRRPTVDPRMEQAGRQEKLDMLVRCYRVRGHMLAKLDPLEQQRPMPPELNPAFYGFTEEDQDKEFSTDWLGGPSVRTLREILNWLRNTYCRSIGAQFMHIDSLTVRSWLQSRMESTGNHIKLNRDEQLRILGRLSEAVLFEEFVQKKYIGAKSFSLEGAESLIPLLDMAIEKAGDDGVQEIVLAMAHRGRLNVLANIMGKSPRLIFREFEDKDPQLHTGRGDVKYHLGYSSDWTTQNGQNIHLSLCFNPSHLEFVNPVAAGRMRAKQDRARDFDRNQSVAIMIHGDAAFAGEGVVQETLNLSQLPGYTTGGTIHVVVNNQIGFTTSPDDSRSSTYATDIAKMLQIPIFHVNGEDPEAVAQVIHLALDFRKEFCRDVVIDMYCYRRRGHNEGDEPEFTQPTLYRAIKKRKHVFEGYLEHLLSLRGITREEADEIVQKRRQTLERELEAARSENFIWCLANQGVWRGYHGGPVELADHVHTGLDKARLSEMLLQLTETPEDFKPHPKIERLLETRRAMAREERPIDWGTAENLALASVAAEGGRVRMTGQDVERGTFSQRHAAIHDFNSGERQLLLQNVATNPEAVELYNSPLSEAGVLGFEYGYSLDCPDGLIIWEAQFGDFANAAQVIFDQFIASSEDKWDRYSGVVMLLPHGFEGQGPEHSSARLERFLSLAAEDNMLIVTPTTPAQHFHCLRQQALRKWKKPLVVMSPKSLLRSKVATSTLDQLADGQFHEVLADEGDLDPVQVDRILLCNGKIYYDLVADRERLEAWDTAIIRLEQLYPLPETKLAEVLTEYSSEVPVYWVQEEPENMGAWRFLKIRFGERISGTHPFHGIHRPISSSPATGSLESHRIEQQDLLDEAFGLEPEGGSS